MPPSAVCVHAGSSTLPPCGEKGYRTNTRVEVERPNGKLLWKNWATRTYPPQLGAMAPACPGDASGRREKCSLINMTLLLAPRRARFLRASSRFTFIPAPVTYRQNNNNHNDSK